MHFHCEVYGNLNAKTKTFIISVLYTDATKAKTTSSSLIIQKRAQKAAKQPSGPPEISVEEDEADDWRDTHVDMTAAEEEEQSRTGSGNGTVFVIPTTPRTPDGCSRWEYLKGGHPDSTSLGWMSELQDGDTTTLGSSSEDTLSRDLEQVSLGSLGKWTWDIHSIILDLSTANFIDTVAIQTLTNVSNKEIKGPGHVPLLEGFIDRVLAQPSTSP